MKRTPFQDSLMYAYTLKEKYDCPIAIENIDGSEETVWDVARAVLSKRKLLQWLQDKKDDHRLLREEYEVAPFDLFDEWYDEQISELKSNG